MLMIPTMKPYQHHTDAGGEKRLPEPSWYPHMRKEHQLAEERRVRLAGLKTQCIRKEHYPPEDSRTPRERYIDTVKYAVSVDPHTWAEDRSRFILYGPSTPMLRDMGFFEVNLTEQKCRVFSCKRMTECRRIDQEFENEVSGKTTVVKDACGDTHTPEL
jgi:hypothetical protein